MCVHGLCAMYCAILPTLALPPLLPPCTCTACMQPMCIWNCGLLIMRESNSYDEANVRQLWDLLCKDEVEAVYRDGGSTSDALRALCTQIIDLASALGPTPWCAAYPHCPVTAVIVEASPG